MKDVNLETTTDTLSFFKILPLNGFNSIRAKQRLHRRLKRVHESFSEPSEKPKVIYTDNSLEFGISCEELSWNHCASTSHRSETNGIAEGERYAEVEKELLLCYCNVALMKNGGRVPWSVTVLCDMFKTSHQLG